MRLSNLINQRSHIIVEVEGEGEVHVHYNPSIYTPNFLEEMRDMDTVVALGKLITEWDLENDDGTVYSLETEEISKLPLRFLNAVMRAITEDMVPKSKSQTDSGSF